MAFDENKKNLSNRRPLSGNARNDFVLTVLKRFEKGTHKHFILLKSKTTLGIGAVKSTVFLKLFSNFSFGKKSFLYILVVSFHITVPSNI